MPHLLQSVRDIEDTALKSSEHVIACTQTDAASFADEYGVDADAITIIENGVDALGVPDVPKAALEQLRSQLGLEERLVAIFGGSFHHPNFLAAERVLELAERLPEMQFVILGSVCNYESLQKTSLKNIILLANVDESTKWAAFRLADIGLNPMELGSGSNIKMFEYAAAEIAVISSPFGARGIGLENESEFMKCELDDMFDTLNKLTVKDRPKLEAIGAKARKKVIQTADWSVIGERYINCFTELLS